MSPISEFMLSLVPDFRGLTTSALLDLVKSGIDDAGNWPDAAFDRLNKRDFASNLDEWPSAKRFAIALDEICVRKTALLPAERETLLALLKPRPESLQRAKWFLRRLSADIEDIKSLQASFRANASAQQRIVDAGFKRVTVVVPEGRVDELKALAVAWVAEAGGLPPGKPRGRPRKASV